MPDLRATLGNCRFYNCTHLHEPGCAVLAHVQKTDDDPASADPQAIGENRYRIYGELFAELSARRQY
jgi:ribosome biogenesis GTPase